MPNFVPYFHFQISGPSFTDENCHNLRNSHDIDNELGAITKLDKSNKATSKNDYDITSANVTSLSCIQFMGNLQPLGGRIPNSWSVKLLFSLIVTFYLTKPENSEKILTHSSHTIALSRGTIFPKKHYFLQQQQQI